jgi:hypothetical protein
MILADSLLIPLNLSQAAFTFPTSIKGLVSIKPKGSEVIPSGISTSQKPTKFAYFLGG